MKFILTLILVFIILSQKNISAQNFYAIDTIQKIEISFSQPNWDYILDTAKQGSDSYTMAQWVKINGVYYDSVGVKYKGNSSFNPNNAKNPLHIELDHFKNQNYLGYKDIKLSNGYHEPSLVREVMLYTFLQNYMKASHANYAHVKINGQNMGLYTNVEAVTNTFLDDRFYSKNNTFVFGDNGGCDLRFKGNDTLMYYTPYTMKSDYGYTDLKNLCYTLNNNLPNIENILDIDRTLWMLAFTNATVTLDSYLGNSKHNYYIYEDHNGRFNPIVWDLNGGFGIFNKPNFGINLTVPQMQNLSTMLHVNDSMWPLVKNILTTPMYKRMYIAHMKTIISENFDNNYYFTFAQYLQNIIDNTVQSDPVGFYTYSQFLSNLTTTVTDGPKTIPGITELMSVRTSYLNSTPEFQQVQPSITNIQLSEVFPQINSNIYITANVTNANYVYLGIRNTVMDRFTQATMFDDGAHGDGTAGDGTFGINIAISSPELQYYIYAENNEAGIFSPQRAENEYYTIDANYTSINTGQVVINEIMAINNSIVFNQNGNYGDWIELYNNSTDTVELNYLNLSDDITNPTKWAFPFGTKILPLGFLIIWADNDSSINELHCDFKFSGNGEQAAIAYSSSNIIDSISFPIQFADYSWGRYPNGTGPFNFMPPTFNAVNSPFGINENLSELKKMILYPNPTNNSITIEIFSSNIKDGELNIFDILGNLTLKQRLTSNSEVVTFDLPGGIYLYKVINDQQIIGNGKIIVQRK